MAEKITMDPVAKLRSILLIYPFFKQKHDKSVFRFPPLGIAYVASSLRSKGYDVNILDCTFLSKKEALKKAIGYNAEIAGIYTMVTMKDEIKLFADELRKSVKLLVAGGPLASYDPGPFLRYMDYVVTGEGERTMCELVYAYENGLDIKNVPGLTYGTSDIRRSPDRKFIEDLDSIPFPARELLPNRDYIAYGIKKYGYAITSVMSSRGCPFACEFCSNIIFGVSYRMRSVENVLDEVEQALSLGYTNIHFGDDVFTFKKDRVLQFCAQVLRRGLKFGWECLGRVDTIDAETASAMKAAGCYNIYFGIESGNDSVLKMMNKRITIKKAGDAVRAAHSQGLKTGAFFILYYPGETDETVINTINYAVSLPLDYLSFTVPYPIPGTIMHKKMKNMSIRDWKLPEEIISGHRLIYNAGRSEFKMKFALLKGLLTYEMKKRLGPLGETAIKIFEPPTSILLKFLK
jgi:anaerobic magnesium-protoporphyrin IX monomethyl ester cyclase